MDLSASHCGAALRNPVVCSPLLYHLTRLRTHIYNWIELATWEVLKDMGKIIGIDLALPTNSVVAVSGRVASPRSSPDQKVCADHLSSVVAFTKTGERLVGQVARGGSPLPTPRTQFSPSSAS